MIIADFSHHPCYNWSDNTESIEGDQQLDNPEQDLLAKWTQTKTGTIKCIHYFMLYASSSSTAVCVAKGSVVPSLTVVVAARSVNRNSDPKPRDCCKV